MKFFGKELDKFHLNKNAGFGELKDGKRRFRPWRVLEKPEVASPSPEVDDALVEAMMYMTGAAIESK